MIAGPSEVLIIADGTGDAAHAAADLLAQAEHDEMASAVLLTPDEAFAGAVAGEVDRQLADLPRKEIASRALAAFGAVVVTRDLAEAVALANRFAPEHLELMVQNPRELLAEIRNAGAIFMGMHTPEALGDYMAGPNHVLPTGGTARFASPARCLRFRQADQHPLFFAGGARTVRECNRPFRRNGGARRTRPFRPPAPGKNRGFLLPLRCKKILTKWSC